MMPLVGQTGGFRAILKGFMCAPLLGFRADRSGQRRSCDAMCAGSEATTAHESLRATGLYGKIT